MIPDEPGSGNPEKDPAKNLRAAKSGQQIGA